LFAGPLWVRRCTFRFLGVFHFLGSYWLITPVFEKQVQDLALQVPVPMPRPEHILLNRAAQWVLSCRDPKE
jgi:hypothetical protein